ncbi:pyridoxal phosphate-dependent aminotransferase [Halodesulfurarchaeum formicicum]|uniref:Aminotransferase n=1 Tax=Halodesulfurarchaeum formicicum TaxID=1873524 RepID=A0A1J1AD72_9EURY|nr:pyridoxal phosphate-dependent aminotransferase [Halodesulfurarchaeum formicicum]APE95671.1 aspartate aminotransferase [Halodesulfurarchaeum formicicum]
MNYTDRVTRVEPSATLAVSSLAAELTAEGVDVVDLSVGEPDFETPEHIKAAGRDAITRGETHYSPSKGIPELREAIAEDLAAQGMPYGPENVMVTPGAKQALFEVVHTVVEDGDEVVLLDPAWVSYAAMAEIAGADLTRVDLRETDFQLEPALDALEAAVSSDTELLIVNSPNNPSGAVYSRAAMEGVRDLAVKYDITVIADEIYEQIRYAGEHVSLATLDGMGERTVTVNGFSKAYAMTGWRLGYFAAPEGLIEQAGKIQSHSVSSAATFVQHAGLQALEGPSEPTAEMVEAFEDRRDMLIEAFAEHGIDVPTPEGAFYMMLPVDDDDEAWCTAALEEAHVATVPGSAFGAPGYARLSYAADERRLREGVDRLAEAGFLD